MQPAFELIAGDPSLDFANTLSGDRFHAPKEKLNDYADLLAFETIPCPEEALALINLLKEFPDVRAWLSFSCRNEEEVSSGANFSACAALANQSDQVLAVGVNCTDPRFG